MVLTCLHIATITLDSTGTVPNYCTMLSDGGGRRVLKTKKGRTPKRKSTGHDNTSEKAIAYVSLATSTGAGIAAAMTGEALRTLVRPNNIGIGAWKKTLVSTEKSLTRGNNVTAVAVGIAGRAIDIGIGIEKNILAGASTGKIIYDAGVDAVCLGGSAVLSYMALAQVFLLVLHCIFLLMSWI